jgi:peptidoglycan/xylan/chitin deacetylase (PgdA/CDA1 family)
MRAILTYHSIDDSGSVLSVDPATFRSHVAWLASGRVRVLSLAEIAEHCTPTDRPHSDTEEDGVDAVALTFDDGFESFATHAWPALRDHGLPASVFVVTDRVGGVNTWEPRDGLLRRPLMDWRTLARLQSEGADIGSHSRTHENLTVLDDERLRAEVAGSSERIRTELGETPSAFAYPDGRFDARVMAVVASHYRCACTTDMHAFRSEDVVYALPRLDSYYLRRPGAIEAWGSARFAAWLRLRAAARNLRRCVLRR